MRVFALLAFVLACHITQAQVYQRITTWYEYDNIRANRFRLPKDTFPTADSGSIAFKGGKLWIKEGSWKELVGGAPDSTTASQGLTMVGKDIQLGQPFSDFSPASKISVNRKILMDASKGLYFFPSDYESGQFAIQGLAAGSFSLTLSHNDNTQEPSRFEFTEESTGRKTSLYRTKDGFSIENSSGATGRVYITNTGKLVADSISVPTMSNSDSSLNDANTAWTKQQLATKIDSVRRRTDSVFEYKNGIEVLAYKDSVGNADSTEIDVFLIGGQSNAVGFTSGTNIYKDSSGRVLQYYLGKIKLANDPVGGSHGISAWPSFGIQYTQLTGRRLCFVPMAVGSSAQVAAATIGGNGNWDASGQLYYKSVDTTLAAMDTLRKYGYSPLFKGVLWDQGETEAVGIRDQTTGVNVSTYKAAFKAMMARYRSVFGKNMKLYMFRIGTSTTSHDSSFAMIRRAQDTLVTEDSLVKMVFYSAIDYPSRGLLNDNVHYTLAGYNEMGKVGAQGVVSDGWYNQWRTKSFNLMYPYTGGTGYVGIGLDSPLTKLHIQDPTNAGVFVERNILSGASNRPFFSTIKSRGTAYSKLPLLANDILGAYSFGGWDGESYIVPATIEAAVLGNVSTNEMAAQIAFSLGTNGSNRTNKFWVTNTGFTNIVGNQGQLSITNQTALGSTSGGALTLHSFLIPSSSNQRLGVLSFGHRNSSSTTYLSTASIAAYSEGAFTSESSQPTYLSFLTAATNSGNTLSERVRITSTGSLNINDSKNTKYRLYIGGSVAIDADSLVKASDITGLKLMALDTTNTGDSNSVKLIDPSVINNKYTLLFTDTSTTTVTDGSSTTFLGNGIGAASVSDIPAGSIIVLKGAGTISNESPVNGNPFIDLTVGASSIGVGLTGLSAGLVNAGYDFEAKFVPVQFGTNKRCIVTWAASVDDNGNVKRYSGSQTNSVISTGGGDVTIDIGGHWSVESAGNSITSTFNTIEIFRK